MAESRRFDAPSPGCLEGLFNFLAINQRLHMPKLIAYRKHGEGNNDPLRVKVPKTKRSAPPPSVERRYGEKDATIPEKTNSHSQMTSLRMFLLRTLMLKKRTHSKDQKESKSPVSSPSSSRLLRSRSIHRSRSSDYMFTGESTSDHRAMSNSSSSELDSWRKSPPLLHKSPRGPAFQDSCKTCGSIDGKYSVDLDAHGDVSGKQLWETEKSTDENVVSSKQKGRDAEMHHSKEFLDFLELFNAHRELFLKILHDPSLIIPTERQEQEASSSDSVPLNKSGSFSRPGGTSGKRNPLFDQSESEQSRRFEIQRSPSSLKAEPEAAKVIATRMPTGTEGSLASLAESRSRKEAATTSNHFKAVRLKIKDVVGKNRKELARITNDGVFHKLPYGQKIAEYTKSPSEKKFVWEEKQIPRSYSITESLDKYSTLYESISRDSKISTQRPSFTIEDSASLQDKNSSLYLKRITSLPIMRLYSFDRDTQAEVSDSPLVPIESGRFSSHHSDVISICTDGSFYPDDITERTADAYSEITYGENSFHDSLEGDIHSILKCPSLPSFDQSFLQDRICCFTERSITDSEPMFEDIHLEDNEWLVKPLQPLDVDAINSEFSLIHEFLDQADPESLHIHVSDKNEADFQYVKDILKKSGFSQGDLLGEWYAADQPVNPVIFEEAECTCQELNMATDEPYSTLDHVLLFDLINEVLLDIYDSSLVIGPWNSQFDSRTRPIPMGSHVLQEVWAKVSHYLSLQREADRTVEGIVVHDIMRKDGWMNLQCDSEYVVLDLEDLMVDDLIDDAILEMDQVSVSKYKRSMPLFPDSLSFGVVG